MKKAFLIGAALILSMIIRPASPAAAEYRLAYVDLQKAISLSKAGQDASQKIKKELEKAEQNYNIRQAELKKLQEVLEKQSAVLNEAARKEKEKEYQTKGRDIQRFLEETQEELKAQENDALKEIFSKLAKITQDYGKEKGFTFIFEKSALPFADETMEITGEIIKRYDAAYAQGGKAAIP